MITLKLKQLLVQIIPFGLRLNQYLMYVEHLKLSLAAPV